jgi:hypothetical protein
MATLFARIISTKDHFAKGLTSGRSRQYHKLRDGLQEDNAVRFCGDVIDNVDRRVVPADNTK